jgi:hypothetical protein
MVDGGERAYCREVWAKWKQSSWVAFQPDLILPCSTAATTSCINVVLRPSPCLPPPLPQVPPDACRLLHQPNCLSQHIDIQGYSALHPRSLHLDCHFLAICCQCSAVNLRDTEGSLSGPKRVAAVQAGGAC